MSFARRATPTEFFRRFGRWNEDHVESSVQYMLTVEVGAERKTLSGVL